jgi:shikimate kinase
VSGAGHEGGRSRGDASIFLAGYRGSGKSSVGRALAQQLGRRFFDTDEMIVQTARQSIREIFESSGEGKFRELEEAAVSLAVIVPSAVVALGGGALEREANRNAISLSGGKVVYLKCTAEELHRRISADQKSLENRPNLTAHAGSVEEVRELLGKRERHYLGMAAVTVDVTMCSVAEAVGKIIASLGLRRS